MDTNTNLTVEEIEQIAADKAKAEILDLENKREEVIRASLVAVKEVEDKFAADVKAIEAVIAEKTGKAYTRKGIRRGRKPVAPGTAKGTRRKMDLKKSVYNVLSTCEEPMTATAVADCLVL